MEQEQFFDCSLCPRIFFTVDQLKSHYEINHEVNKLKPIWEFSTGYLCLSISK